MISVLIPTYKRTNDLKRCLHSILNQSRPADEILVIVQSRDEETLSLLHEQYAANPVIKPVIIQHGGQVNALNNGLDTAIGDIIAITDDDTAPHNDWLERIELHFASDPRLGGLGGRDWVYDNGHIIDGSQYVIGKLLWFGKVVGNHHLGAGVAREVDLLKGANMSYRRSAIGSIRFNPHLLGTGAQVYNDMDFSMAVKHSGWKLLYDPEVAVDHYPAKRHDEDQRNTFNSIALSNMVHNETIVILRYFKGWRRVLYMIWALFVGMSSSPGFFQWLRLLVVKYDAANEKWLATMKGRREGIRTWRKVR